jgi:hypothetical protein
MKKMNKMYAAPKAEMIELMAQTPVLSYSSATGNQPEQPIGEDDKI